MINHTTFAVSAIFLLSACGGGGGATYNVAPISTSGFAAPGEGFGGPYEFVVEGATRTVGENGALSQEIGAPIRIVGVSRMGDIEVSIGDATYTLERASGNSGRAVLEADGNTVSLSAGLPATEFVQLTSLFAFVDGNLNSGYFPLGFDTDPAIIARLEGDAVFSGQMVAALRAGFSDAFGRGDVTMTVSFDRNMIAGGGVLIDDQQPSADFNFDPITLRFEPTPITANGFAGTLSITSPVNGTLNDATYDGRFFGPNGESVAGQFVGRVDVNGTDTDTFINGGFLASQ